MTGRRLIVIGAGPAGLAAALAALERGWDATVIEREGVGASLLRWGSTRFFTPLSMNLPAQAAAILGAALPPLDALLTGPEFVERVLLPLASRPPLEGRIRTGHQVVAVGRARLTRADYPGHPLRSERGFRLLIETGSGERVIEAEAVVDASGTYDLPLAIGAGGIPAPGERASRARLLRTLGDLERNLPRLAGKRTLLIGHGHSAATAILLLASLAGQSPSTRVTWATRSLNRRPCVEVAADPLPERARVAIEANELAAHPPPWLTVERRALVEAFDARDGLIGVKLSGGREWVGDEIAAFTGYRPDLSFLSEMALDIDAATEGPARLARALRNVTDCLSVPRLGAGDLHSGEAGFSLAGSKSYGRSRTFLLQSGYRQIESIVAALG